MEGEHLRSSTKAATWGPKGRPKFLVPVGMGGRILSGVPLFRRREVRAEPEPARRADREEVARRLMGAAPAGGPALAASLLPAVRFATRRVPEAAIDHGQSKLGGSPDLPHGSAWPCWTTPQGDRRPLQFFAQVDLAAVAAAAPAPLGFPTEGQLSFFADFEVDAHSITGRYPWEREGAIVLYSPPTAPLTRCSPRMQPLPSGQLQPIGVWTWPSSPDHAVVPAGEGDALEGVQRGLEAELRAEAPELWHVTARHQLGGRARYIREPVEEEVVRMLAGLHPNGAPVDQAAWERARPQVADWRVVLQLESDPTLEVAWGDQGTIWWSARHADIAAGIWDAGVFTFQSQSQSRSRAPSA